MSERLISYRGVVQQWQCDHLGHLNTRYYMAFFDEAMQTMFHLLGYTRQTGFGWADVKHEIEYKDELEPGTIVHVDAGIIRVGGKSLSYQQRLISSDDGRICAINNAVTVLLDTSERAAVTLPDAIRENAKKYLIENS